MGMYDSFYIDYPMPIEPWIPEKYRPYIYYTFASEGFQSKSMHCLMESYHIDNNGYIYLDDVFWFEEPPIQKDLQKIYYHGHIQVYTPVYLTEDESRDINKMLWFEYDLKFTNGLLVNATMISPTKEDLYGLHRNI